MRKNIMLAFVSPVNAFFLGKPINYPDIQGRPYSAIQTNESAIVYVSRMLEPQSLAQIFLIASDSVKNEKIQPENEFGDVTHLEFLRRRIAKEFPQLAEKFSIQNYSEDGTGSTKLENNILQIAQIADAVTDFAKNSAEVVVHADMTGGFRHTSMLMLSIIQLLRYRGIKIGEVLYSEPASREVYRVTEIQRMFTLITGADEFVKFGSVEALNEYFGAEPPPAVKNLLEAMNRFAEAIKICRTSAIEGELENLSKHIKNFREHPDRDLKSELFAKIIDTIEREYGKLIDGAATRLEIIRWCMRKGFWQQAMTLCTEWLPEEIINRRVCMPRDITVIESCTSKGRSAHKSWQQYFIIDYRVSEQGTNTRTVCGDLRDALNSGDANRLPELKKFVGEYSFAEMDFNSCARKKISVNDFKGKYPTLAAVLQIIFDERRANPSYRRNFYSFLQTVDYAKIPILIAGFSNEQLLQVFNIERDQPAKKDSTPADKAENLLYNREREYRELFRQKRISLKPDVDAALKILRNYHAIRHERNQINHANEYSTTKIPELRRLIEGCLAALEKLNA
ncbi:MAG: TM1812 family CRISPR-associated protein [Quinella sp. 3Q1]|nr:TM1812 family CRISPR-associated protein [Quinella sp. 3Q1]